MSYGTKKTYKTKKALRDAVEIHGADKILVFDTSLHDNKGTVTLASLADTSAQIVGPDVYKKRVWYARIETIRGEIRVV